MFFARLEAHFRQRDRLFGESLCVHVVQNTRVIWYCPLCGGHFQSSIETVVSMVIYYASG